MEGGRERERIIIRIYVRSFSDVSCLFDQSRVCIRSCRIYLVFLIIMALSKAAPSVAAKAKAPSPIGFTPTRQTRVAVDLSSPPSMTSAANLFRVPKPTPTNSPIQDDLNTVIYNTTCDVFRAVLEEPGNVMACWNKICGRKRKLANTQGTDGTSFPKAYATLGKLIDEEPDWIINYLVSVGDLNAGDYMMLLATDKEVLAKLVQADTQLSLSVRLSPELLTTEVLWRVFGILSKKYGHRLRTIKTDKVFLEASQTIDWAKLNFNLTYNVAGVLTRLQHRPSGLEAAKVESFGITRDWDLRNPWSDQGAQLVKEPLAPTKIASSFFLKKLGPNSYDNPSKLVVLNEVIREAIQTWSQSVKDSNGCSPSSGKDAKKLVADRAKLDNADAMQLLRAKAGEAMKKKKAKATVSMKAS
jgi:hypothetical protein